MKKVLGYALAFALGSTLSGTAAFAATNYVQAKKATTTIVVNGKTVSHPTTLSYGGNTYLPVSAIQQGLSKLGVKSSWNGKTFNMTKPSSTPSQPSNPNLPSFPPEPTPQPPSQSTNWQAVTDDIASKFQTITVNGVTLHFTYLTDLNVSVGTYYGLTARIDPNDYGNYLQLAMHDPNAVQQAFLPVKDELSKMTRANGFTKFMVDYLYQDTYDFYPSSYDPSEISVTYDGKFLVTHSIVLVSDSGVTVK
jgi:hypothetical protein